MRRINAGVFMSLDGVMQAPGGPGEDDDGGFTMGGWLPPIGDEGIFETVGALFTPPYALLLGRKTYDIFAGHWPFVEGEEAAFGQALTAADKYVVTSRTDPLPWANSHRLASIDAVAALKHTDGPDLLIQGSSTLYPALLAAGLIDRLTIMTFPVVLGHGKRLFGTGTPPLAMRMVEHRVTPRGTVVATYEPEGPAQTGHFLGHEPKE
ncbi:dihydrofolate reductase [Sphingomonas jinjuensis]|uniref:Dihydrofolate reductase n=1 Tax=Sphingomonas jinjuensis TaxID=535907 RepID=A0A840FCY8_9SPHN|nr:dihydrofolate reductase family protein [Sphingomonas jinjuensis]MBB4155479.1 dihydrofolate reductase [Sphingomonas jinjuensis]